MPNISSDYSTSEQIKLVRKYLKFKISEDNVTFRNHAQARSYVYDLMKRTVLQGESLSALLIGPRGCGKTTLINSTLSQLSSEVDLVKDAHVVRLNGLVHGDEKTALKSITAQMQLENAVGDRVFGTFAENLAFLLGCLESGTDRRCRSMLFLLEEFDMFCHSGMTQLLYNLFNITHTKQAPLFVLGTTNRVDFMELLEKRNKSRFSHRHIVIFPNEVAGAAGMRRVSPVSNYKDILVKLLSIPPSVAREARRRNGRRKSVVTMEDMDIDEDQCAVPEDVLTRGGVDRSQFCLLQRDFIESWNCLVKSLVEDEAVVDAIEKLCYYTVNEQIFRNILFQVVAQLSPDCPYIDAAHFTRAVDGAVCAEQRVRQLQSLSVLQLSLVVAMMHGMDVFDGQPMNFEMVLHRYTKFAKTNSSTQTVPRAVIMKAFEGLRSLEIILPVRSDSTGGETASRVQKEYVLYTLAVPVDEIREAVKGFKALPTEIRYWFENSVC